MLKKLLKSVGIVLLFFIVIFDFMFLMELKKAEGNTTKAAVRSIEECCE